MLVSSQAVSIPAQHTPHEQPPARKLNYKDPIFKRRNYAYSTEELRYIFRLSPLESVPRSYIPTLENPCPPVVVRGWILDDKTQKFLLQEAHRRNTLCIQKAFVYPDDYDEDDDDADDDLESLPEVDIIEETISRNMAATAIFKELGITFLPLQPIELVAVHGAYASALSLYTNYDLHRCPPKEDVEKVRAHFGFTSEPGWFPGGIHCQWVE